MVVQVHYTEFDGGFLKATEPQDEGVSICKQRKTVKMAVEEILRGSP